MSGASTICRANSQKSMKADRLTNVTNVWALSRSKQTITYGDNYLINKLMNRGGMKVWIQENVVRNVKIALTQVKSGHTSRHSVLKSSNSSYQISIFSHKKKWVAGLGVGRGGLAETRHSTKDVLMMSLITFTSETLDALSCTETGTNEEWKKPRLCHGLVNG